MYFINCFFVNFALLLFHMKKLITLFSFVSLAVSGWAQSDYADSTKAIAHRQTVADRINVSVYTGAGVGFIGKSAVSSSTYFAPVVGYRFTPKFKLNMGLLHYNINGNTFINRALTNNHFPENRYAASGNLLLLEGQYALNHRTIVSGAVLYNVPSFSGKQGNYKGATFGLDYKVTPHTTFSIRTTVIQGNGNLQPYERSMFGTNPTMSPAGLMMMGSPFNMTSSPFSF